MIKTADWAPGKYWIQSFGGGQTRVDYAVPLSQQSSECVTEKKFGSCTFSQGWIRLSKVCLRSTAVVELSPKQEYRR